MDVLIEEYEQYGVNPRVIVLRIGTKDSVIEIETSFEELDDAQDYIAKWVERKTIKFHETKTKEVTMPNIKVEVEESEIKGELGDLIVRVTTGQFYIRLFEDELKPVINGLQKILDQISHDN